ncbi:MAG: TonB-dependent receptor plug domain-containing protein, partial [Verrucomicrobiaceae bacterium]|nr:TonB-dependent receptor plug domain-containing protein [Verrucomicrobiaceae bacterium]
MYLPKLRGRAFALFFTLGSLSAAEPQKAVELTERVITATKTETERWRTASSVTVIDRKKIEQDQLRLLPDALRQVPGLNIADRGTTGTVTGIFLRGTNSDQTLVVLDGRPIPANLAGLYNIETMALDNVERIEVLRGPAASIYGGKTLGGVINIITRGGKGLEKPEFGAFFETGSFGTFREGVSTRGDAGIMDWSL